MKHIKLLEQFINEGETMTSTEIVQYLHDINIKKEEYENNNF